jgi:signal transduction histidine kinase
MTLLFLLILQCGLFLPLWSGIPFSLVITGSALFPRAPGDVWGIPLDPPDFVDRVSLLFYSLLMTVTAGLLRYEIDSLRRGEAHISKQNATIDRLITANMEFQEYANTASVRSRNRERKRISRDIHDTIGYSLTNMIMMMEAATDLVGEDQEKLRGIISLTRDQAQKGLSETRKALKELRSAEEKRYSGLPAIHELISIFEKVTGITVVREYGNFHFYFPEKINQFLFRMVQEGLTNAFRHGNATEILIQFWVDDRNILTLRIRDNGKGAEEEIKEGIGLVGMRERLESVRGTLEARNVVDGFEIAAHIPLENIRIPEKTEEDYE